MKKQKLKLDDFKVQSFVTSFDKAQGETADVKGGWTGDCGTRINVTCGQGCDFPSLPLDECRPNTNEFQCPTANTCGDWC